MLQKKLKCFKYFLRTSFWISHSFLFKNRRKNNRQWKKDVRFYFLIIKFQLFSKRAEIHRDLLQQLFLLVDFLFKKYQSKTENYNHGESLSVAFHSCLLLAFFFIGVIINPLTTLWRNDCLIMLSLMLSSLSSFALSHFMLWARLFLS